MVRERKVDIPSRWPLVTIVSLSPQMLRRPTAIEGYSMETGCSAHRVPAYHQTRTDTNPVLSPPHVMSLILTYQLTWNVEQYRTFGPQCLCRT